MSRLSTKFSDRFPADKREPRTQYITRYGYEEAVVYADSVEEAKQVALRHFQPPTNNPHLVKVSVAKPSQML